MSFLKNSIIFLSQCHPRCITMGSQKKVSQCYTAFWLAYNEYLYIYLRSVLSYRLLAEVSGVPRGILKIFV